MGRPVAEKKCETCQTTKPASLFGRANRSPDLLTADCNACRGAEKLGLQTPTPAAARHLVARMPAPAFTPTRMPPAPLPEPPPLRVNSTADPMWPPQIPRRPKTVITTAVRIDGRDYDLRLELTPKGET